jgi:hypothetical protein
MAGLLNDGMSCFDAGNNCKWDTNADSVKGIFRRRDVVCYRIWTCGTKKNDDCERLAQGSRVTGNAFTTFTGEMYKAMLRRLPSLISRDFSRILEAWKSLVKR